MDHRFTLRVRVPSGGVAPPLNRIRRPGSSGHATRWAMPTGIWLLQPGQMYCFKDDLSGTSRTRKEPEDVACRETCREVSRGRGGRRCFEARRAIRTADPRSCPYHAARHSRAAGSQSPRSAARVAACGLICCAAKIPRTGGQLRVAIHQLQVAGQLLDAVNLTSSLYLHRDVQALSVTQQEIHRASACRTHV